MFCTLAVEITIGFARSIVLKVDFWARCGGGRNNREGALEKIDVCPRHRYHVSFLHPTVATVRVAVVGLTNNVCVRLASPSAKLSVNSTLLGSFVHFAFFERGGIHVAALCSF